MLLISVRRPRPLGCQVVRFGVRLGCGVCRCVVVCCLGPCGVVGVRVSSGVLAGVVGGAVGGVPSTVFALVRGRDPLAAALAVGRVVLPDENRTGRLLAVALPVHVGISALWGCVLARVLPARGAASWGAVAGVGIAALDLRLPGRRMAAVRALPVLPQVVDHLVYGAVVGACLRRRALRLR